MSDTPIEKKPREWWIAQHESGAMFIYAGSDPNPHTVPGRYTLHEHVITHSAYTDLKAELEQTKQALEKLRIGKFDGHYHESLRAEYDLLCDENRKLKQTIAMNNDAQLTYEPMDVSK